MLGISVVMPAYNCQKTIRTALSSTLRALSPEDELVLVEDGSTDLTHKIASEFSDSRLRIIRNSENLGIAASLNKGISYSRNQLICRADADDVVPIWRFAIQKRVFATNRVDFLFGSQLLIWKSLLIFPIHTFTNRGRDKDISKILSIACILPHPTMMAKKGAIIDLGGYNQVIAEDYELWLRALSKGYKILRHWFPQNYYRLRHDSLSNKDALMEGYLDHLSQLRLFAFRGSSNLANPKTISEMRRFRRRLLLRDPLLFLETGILSDPLKTIDKNDS